PLRSVPMGVRVVQTMAKSAARQVTNQIVRGMLGSLLGGRKR
ncbi:helicase HerA-like domain-containing protein, partial [Escherichia sp. HC-CC]